MTRPGPVRRCEYCEFQGHCEAQWRAEDSLAFVANVREDERDALESGGRRDRSSHSPARSEPVPDLRDEKLRATHRQAALQVATRERPGCPAGL